VRIIERLGMLAGEPKDVLVLEGLDHHDLGGFPDVVCEPVLAFLGRVLPTPL
jgi:hypothetical protein